MTGAPCIDDGRWSGINIPGMPVIMGIVNVTPDSFSDGGDYNNTDTAIRHALSLLDQGAQIIDIGGESTRPGADPVDPITEQARIMPVVMALVPLLRARGALLSIDTRHATTMNLALNAGADMINDVSALTHDADAVDIVAQYGCPVILMHIKGQPDNMQDAPCYQDVVAEVAEWLRQRVTFSVNHGIGNDRIWIDPGIGFGKTTEHNIDLLARMDRLSGIGSGILLGVSRKRFVAALSANEPPQSRLPGSLAALLAAMTPHIRAVRVHDVMETRQAMTIWHAIKSANKTG